MAEAPWYKDGLRFQCTQCGDCCTGAPGYVWVNKAEIEAMARLLDTDVGTFEKKFVRKIGIRKSLVEHANFDCVLFDNKSKKCRVYAARPRQCRTWPFWDSNIKTRETWEVTCEMCPGSGRGPLVPIEAVIQQAAVIKI